MNRYLTQAVAQTIGVVLIAFLACSCNQRAGNDRDNQRSGLSDSAAAIATRDSVTIELVGVDSQTVFDLLRNTHQVQYRSSAIGVFVTAIDSIETSGSFYWVYSVNDSMPQIACDKYLTTNSDVVKWHFRKGKR